MYNIVLYYVFFAKISIFNIIFFFIFIEARKPISLIDDKRSDRPSEVDDDKMEAIIELDHQI